MINGMILAGWIIRALKACIHYWYVTIPALIFLGLYVYFDYQKHVKARKEL